MKFLAAFSLLLFLLPSISSVNAQQSQKQTPIQVDDEQEIAAHRLGALKPIIVRLKGELAQIGGTLPIKVIVGSDGTLVSAELDDEVGDLDDGDVPKETVAEMKRVLAEALAQVRALRYQPFVRDGEAREVTFNENVVFIPPEMTAGPHVDFPEIKSWQSLRVTLERTGCFGTCPSYAIVIQGDGTVKYTGRGYVALSGDHHGWIPKENVLQIVEAFRHADYFSLRDKYAAGITDNPTYTTKIEFDGHKKQVVDYVGAMIGMPPQVTELEDKIDELADTARWTKGNANTLAALQEEGWHFKGQDAANSLARVVFYGSAQAVCDLASTGIPLNGRDEANGFPLDRAAFRGDVVMLQCLLARTSGDPGELATALSNAARTGKLDALKQLFTVGASVNTTPRVGDPPIVAAAASGIPEIVREVLKHRPDISAHAKEGPTALIAAAGSVVYNEKDPRRNPVETVRLLLDAGADVNARDGRGNTALIENAWDPNIAKLLIDHGADINAQNTEGWTALFSASSAKLTRFLIQEGASTAIRDNKGETALQAARNYGDPEKVAVLEAAEAGTLK